MIQTGDICGPPGAIRRTIPRNAPSLDASLRTEIPDSGSIFGGCCERRSL